MAKLKRHKDTRVSVGDERGEVVPLGGGLVVFERFAVAVEDPRYPRVDMEIVCGGELGPRCVELKCSRPDNDPHARITRQDLAALPVPTFIEWALEIAARRVFQDASGQLTLVRAWMAEGEEYDRQMERVREAFRTGSRQQRLQEIAERFQAAKARGSRSPAKDVADELGYSRSYVRHLLMEARKPKRGGK